MSETTPEAPAGGGTQTKPSASGGKLGVWGKKMGPLPAWGWAAILLTGVIVFMYYKNKNSANTATSTNTADNSVAASQIPQFVNQTYVNGTPPAATPTATTPPAAPASNFFRNIATGKESLAAIAKSRNTTVAQLLATAQADFAAHPNGGGITQANLTALQDAAKTPNKPLKAGTVIYTSNVVAPGNKGITPSPGEAN